MPCAPNWEERMVLEGESTHRKFTEEYPGLKDRASKLLAIFKHLDLDPPFQLPYVAELPQKPLISDGWPTEEDGRLMMAYSEKVMALFSDLELWICVTATQLVLTLDTMPPITNSKLSAEIVQQIEAHKKHREEDRAEVIKNLEQQINYQKTGLKNNVNKNPIIQKNYQAKKELLEKKLFDLKALTIEELIRNRSLTDI
jgi:hypothetical protein